MTSGPERTGAAKQIRLGVGMFQGHRPERLIEIVRACEALGVHTFWYANEKFYRDPYVGLALAALNTRTMRLGTFVADPYTAHPALTAVSIATIDELSGGRAILLLGAGGGGGTPLGYRRTRPAVAIREAIEVIRGLLAGEQVDFQGEVIQFGSGRLHFLARAELPIYVASRGNLVLQAAGEAADGVMIATYATPDGVRHALGMIDRGLARSGRRRDDLTLISRVDTCVVDDPRQARDTMRPFVAQILMTSYPDRGFVRALGLRVPNELEAVVAKKDRDLAHAAANLVPDELVEAFSWAGTPDEVAGKIAAVASLGIRDVTVLLHPTRQPKPEETIERMVKEVMPRVEARLAAKAGHLNR